MKCWCGMLACGWHGMRVWDAEVGCWHGALVWDVGMESWCRMLAWGAGVGCESGMLSTRILHVGMVERSTEGLG